MIDSERIEIDFAACVRQRAEMTQRRRFSVKRARYAA